jgi:hypothetical protein
MKSSEIKMKEKRKKKRKKYGPFDSIRHRFHARRYDKKKFYVLSNSV